MSAVIASQRVRPLAGPMTGSAKQSRRQGEQHLECSPRQVVDFGFCNMHSKVINPLSKSILVINPFLPNFAQCAVTIWYAEDWVPATPTLLGIVPPFSSPMTLSPVCPSKLPPELAQPVTKGSATSTGITKTIRDIVYNPSAFVERGIA